jgi:large subunit ribosomal protein L6
MSRIGRTSVAIPAGVEVTLGEGNVITVKGPKGTITEKIHPNMTVTMENNTIHVSRPNDEKLNRSLHGLSRALIANMVTGVSNEFKRNLEINGVGYRAAKEGNKLVMNLGYSHQVIMTETDDIKIDVLDQNHVVIHGPNKQKVGQFAANVRDKRPPEPYKGKGIKYSDEVIRRKEGKTGK